MHLPKSWWGKVLAFFLLISLAALTGALLGKFNVVDKYGFGMMIMPVLYVGIQLKTGMLVVGRSWNMVITTRDRRPQLYWTVISIEIVVFVTLFVRGIYQGILGTQAPH